MIFGIGDEVRYTGPRGGILVGVDGIRTDDGEAVQFPTGVTYPFLITGGLSVGSRLVTASPATISAAVDHTVTFDATAAPIVANLPALTAALVGTQYTFKKVDTSAHAVTITPAGADTLDGAATLVLGAQYSTLGIEAMQIAVATFMCGVTFAFLQGPADSGGLGFRVLCKTN